MGVFTSYSLAVSVYMLLGWGVYRCTLAGCKQAAFNRRALLAVYVISFIAPLMRGALQAFAAIFHRGGAPAIGMEMPGLMLDAGQVESAPLWPSILVAVYIAGALIVAIRIGIGVLGVWKIIRKGSRVKMPGFTLVSVSDSGIAPFSFGRFIVAPEAMLGEDSLVLRHEFAHISHGHRYDLIAANLVCIFQWFNPAAWLMLSDLRCIHEYEADESVLAKGVDMRSYQRMLVGNFIAGHSNVLTNSFNSNLKKRIAMMYQLPSSGRSRLRALLLIPALAIGFGLVQVPAVASVLAATSAAALPESSRQEPAGTPDSDVRMVVVGRDQPQAAEKGEVLPQYPGGESAMYAFLVQSLNFPESMAKDDISGRVVVGFTVEPDGSLSNIKVVKSLCPDADNEAMRVVRSMPRWIPGSSDGKPVACSMVLPFNFALVNDNSKAAQQDIDPADIRVVAFKSDSTQKTVLNYDSLKKKPAIFVDGTLFTGDINSISPDDIESITVHKDRPEYPDGLLDITLKKK